MELPTIPSAATVVASQSQASTDVDDEVVILNFDAGVYYGLEDVGARVWELLREPHTVAELREKLIGEYDVEAERCATDLDELLGQLVAAGLVEVADGG
jgi:hypothetical protein